MSDDGADLGVSADRALQTILGGAPQPTRRRTPEEMRAEILACEGPSDYDGTSRWVARLILDAIEKEPALMMAPCETVYDWDAIKADPRYANATGSEGVEVLREHVVSISLYDLMKDRGISLAELGLTGFMWGWAFNAARYCLGLPSEPNPAIVTL